MYTLTGKALTTAELEQIPTAFRFYVTDGDLIASNDDANVRGGLNAVDTGAELQKAVTFQCPVGPHSDPGLSGAVSRACSIGPAKDVAVQCTLGHWAQYPCL